MRILLVDDDDDLRQSVATFLTARGHEVKAYATGCEALAVAEFYEPDVVVSDIQMPHMNGIELLQRIRQLDADLPVILLTSQQSIETAVAALRHRAYDYLEKPVDLTVLYACVERLRGS